MIETYWAMGQYIVEHEQQGNERAVYGSGLIDRLSKDLTNLYGKGFGKSNLLYYKSSKTLSINLGKMSFLYHF